MRPGGNCVVARERPTVRFWHSTGRLTGAGTTRPEGQSDDPVPRTAAAARAARRAGRARAGRSGPGLVRSGLVRSGCRGVFLSAGVAGVTRIRVSRRRRPPGYPDRAAFRIRACATPVRLPPSWPGPAGPPGSRRGGRGPQRTPQWNPVPGRWCAHRATGSRPGRGRWLTRLLWEQDTPGSIPGPRTSGHADPRADLERARRPPGSTDRWSKLAAHLVLTQEVAGSSPARSTTADRPRSSRPRL
jgi:hypothetical protein